MANEEQLSILKQGAKVWDKWGEENPEVKADLSGADLSGADLSGADLRYADLSSANLSGANLSEARLFKTDLRRTDLRKADLRKANLSEADLDYATNLGEADLSGANLSGANLRGANLSGANLSGSNLRGARLSANLREADLRGAYLVAVNFSGAILSRANFSDAQLGVTSFPDNDLSKIDGLESTQHQTPSNVSTNTLQLSKGEIPEAFLRGCGLSDWEIESAKLYKPGLSNQEIIDINYKIFDLRANQAIQISPLFISYSHADTEFVEKFEPHLIEKGIRFWRDTHDMKSGRMEKQVDHAMRQNPTVILILSENSTRSDWVEHEARLARELEKELNRDVLCPIALDDSWKSAKWPARLMEQIKEYNILDYSNWRDDKAFGQVFNKMISGLDMFYKPESPK
jgi:uncharacterized protein YjbI with pentapeptide repeats